jgi:LysM repeat protein
VLVSSKIQTTQNEQPQLPRGEIMNKKYWLLTLIIILALALVGCQRSASTPPPGTEGSDLVQPVDPNATLDPMAVLQQYATQTALAASGTQVAPNATPGGETPVPAFTPMNATADPNNPALPTPTPAGGSAGAATAMPVINVPTPTPGIPASYTLQSGEYPYCIARRFNVNPDELLSLNGLANGQVYDPGMTLNIPQTGHQFPGTRYLIPHPATYVVKAGDTIYSISCDYGDVDPNQVALANALVPPYTLSAGATINIP